MAALNQQDGIHHINNWPLHPNHPPRSLPHDSTLIARDASGVPLVTLHEGVLQLRDGQSEPFKYFQAQVNIARGATIIKGEEPIAFWRSYHQGGLEQLMDAEIDKAQVKNALRGLQPPLHQGDGHQGEVTRQQVLSNRTPPLPFTYAKRQYVWQGLFHYRSFLNHDCDQPYVYCFYHQERVWEMHCSVIALTDIKAGEILVMKYENAPAQCMCPSKHHCKPEIQRSTTQRPL